MYLKNVNNTVRYTLILVESQPVEYYDNEQRRPQCQCQGCGAIIPIHLSLSNLNTMVS